MANDNANKNKLKIQKSKVQVSAAGACLPVGRDPSEEKVKTLIISSHCESRSFGTKQSPIIPSCHCESRPFVNNYIKWQIKFLSA